MEGADGDYVRRQVRQSLLRAAPPVEIGAPRDIRHHDRLLRYTSADLLPFDWMHAVSSAPPGLNPFTYLQPCQSPSTVAREMEQEPRTSKDGISDHRGAFQHITRDAVSATVYDIVAAGDVSRRPLDSVLSPPSFFRWRHHRDAACSYAAITSSSVGGGNMLRCRCSRWFRLLIFSADGLPPNARRARQFSALVSAAPLPRAYSGTRPPACVRLIAS